MATGHQTEDLARSGGCQTQTGNPEVSDGPILYFTISMWERHTCQQIRDSIVVSISACHADDPGSIPGRGVLLSSAASRLFVPRSPLTERYPASVQANGQCSLAVERLLRKQKVAGSIPVVGFFHCSPRWAF